jgi:hypothetical protein
MGKVSRLLQGLIVPAVLFGLTWVGASSAADTAKPVEKGQRIFTAGHSFLMFMPPILRDMAQAAGIQDHVQVGVQSIGGSRVIQHWNLPDDKNKAKEALQTGKVDVLILSPIFLPDEGIDDFTKLALAHNPAIRVMVQEFWLPFDDYNGGQFPPKERPAKVDHNAKTVEELRKQHAPYFESMNAHVRELNQKHGKQVLFVVPVGQAVLSLRAKISAGEAPGLQTQEDLFTDAVGHAKPPLAVLAAYCHFATVYRRRPVGLPVPAALAKQPEAAKLNRLLQDLAWDAVRQHPLSGVKGE